MSALAAQAAALLIIQQIAETSSVPDATRHIARIARAALGSHPDEAELQELAEAAERDRALHWDHDRE